MKQVCTQVCIWHKPSVTQEQMREAVIDAPGDVCEAYHQK